MWCLYNVRTNNTNSICLVSQMKLEYGKVFFIYWGILYTKCVSYYRKHKHIRTQWICSRLGMDLNINLASAKTRQKVFTCGIVMTMCSTKLVGSYWVSWTGLWICLGNFVVFLLLLLLSCSACVLLFNVLCIFCYYEYSSTI